MNRAKQFLTDNGWIKDYYYVLKVLESTRTCTKVQPIFKASLWGYKILNQKLDWIIDNAKGLDVSSKIAIRTTANEYTSTIRARADEIFNIVMSKH